MTASTLHPTLAVQSQFIDIDEGLQDSRQQWWQWGGFLLLVVGVLALLSLPLSYRLLLMVLSLVCVGLSQLNRSYVTAISTLSTANRLANTPQTSTTQTGIDNVEWQLGIVPKIALTEFFTPIKSNVNHSQLWQGQLLASYHIGKAVILSFAITAPMPRRLTVTLWQDQLSETAWRQLVALAQLHR